MDFTNTINKMYSRYFLQLFKHSKHKNVWEKADILDVKRLIGIYSKEDKIGPNLNMEDVITKRRTKMLLEKKIKDNDEKRHRLMNVFEIPNLANGIEGRGATTNPAAKWQNCQVPYEISDSFTRS